MSLISACVCFDAKKKITKYILAFSKHFRSWQYDGILSRPPPPPQKKKK